MLQRRGDRSARVRVIQRQRNVEKEKFIENMSLAKSDLNRDPQFWLKEKLQLNDKIGVPLA